MKVHAILIVLAFAGVLTSCGPAAMALKRSKKLEAAGLGYEAAEAALDAVEANPNNTKALVQAKTVGQRELKRIGLEFENRAEANEVVGALESYVRGRRLVERAAESHVELTGLEAYTGRFAQLRKGHVDQLVAQADAALNSSDFSGAQRLFENALRYDPDNAPIRSQWRIAVAEPLFRQGLQSYRVKRYRTAYYQWVDMEKAIGQAYKNSRQMQDSAVFHGKVTVGIRDVIAPTRQELDLARGLRADLMSNLIQTQEPFIEWIDYNEQTRFASTKQPDLLLNMEMTDWQEMPGTATRFERQGYRKETVKVKDPQTGVETSKDIFHKVTYYDIDYRVFIKGTFLFKLEDVEKKQILSSREVSDSREQIVATAEYSGGTYATLFPGSWGSLNEARATDVISYNQKGQLDSRFRTVYNPRAIDTMRDQIRDGLTKKASNILFETLRSPTFLP
jgi:tetratricopeptide (TPR) repeat protein